MAHKKVLLWLSGLVLWGLLSGLLMLLPIPLSLLPIAWFLVLVIGVALLIWLALEVGKVVPNPWGAIFGLIGFGLRVAMSFQPLPESVIGRVAFSAFSDTLMLASALLLGSAISPLIRHANLIPPIAIVLSIVDIWTVLLGGFVAQVQQKAEKGVAVAQRIVEMATVKMPTIASPQHAFIGIPLIGIGDIFFAAFLFALLWRFGLNVQTVYILSVIFVAIGLIIAQFVPFGIPGLPFIVLAILLPNLSKFKYTPDERKALLIGAIFLIGLLAIFSIIASKL